MHIQCLSLIYKVGLRWWNYIDDEGHSQWMFESRNSDSAHMLSAPEIRIFWSGLVAAPALWLIFLITALMGLKLQWMVLVMVGLTLTTSNLVSRSTPTLHEKLDPHHSLSAGIHEMPPRPLAEPVRVSHRNDELVHEEANVRKLDERVLQEAAANISWWEQHLNHVHISKSCDTFLLAFLALKYTFSA